MLSACLSVPDGPEPMCEKTSDCDSVNGEICDDGICWGNPPPGAFAAIVSPPAENANLTSRELATVNINSDGWIDELQLEKPVVYTASLACRAPVQCDSTMLSATITVTRPSTFPGGPGFRSVVKTKDGMQFKLTVPPAHDARYTSYAVTVIPDGRDESASQTTPAQVLPPLRMTLTIDGNATGKFLELGEVGGIVSGVIKNDAGEPQANYRVTAIGKWDATQAPTEVSTVDFTGSDGTFSLQLSNNLQKELEIVAKPVAPTLTRPTLHYAGEIGTTGAANLVLQWPEGAGSGFDLDVPVKAVDGNGVVKPARGARVIVSAKAPSANGEATYVAEATTDDNGNAHLSLLDGEAFRSGYRISIVPQAGATSGTMFNQPFSILQPIPPQQLKTRVALKGHVTLAGKGIKDMSVTARPSLRFVWNVETADQAFLTSIPPSTAVTPESGEFVLWVDQPPGDLWGFYDLTFEAADGSNAPTVTIPAVGVPPATAMGMVDLGVYDLPFPAYVRSSIYDDKANYVEGAELKIYRTEDFASLCSEALHPPANCTNLANAATLLGRGTSDENGEVRLTLPR
jgi:hypothetical protein